MTNIAALADKYAAAKIAADAAVEAAEAIKAEILATGRDEIIGDRFKVSVGLGERTSVSAKEVKELLSPELFAKVSKTTVYPSVRYKAIKA